MTIEALAKTQEELIQYHLKTGWNISRSKIAPVVFAFRGGRKSSEHVEVKAWAGVARVPSWYHVFRSEKQAQQACAELVEKTRAWKERGEARKAEKRSLRQATKAADLYAVGDVFYTSWGYDQTNVDYFQIVRLNPRSVTVRQVLVNNSDHGQPGGGKVAPRRNDFVGPEILCPLSAGGSFSAGPCHGGKKPSYRHLCHKWTGRAVYTSSDR